MSKKEEASERKEEASGREREREGQRGHQRSARAQTHETERTERAFTGEREPESVCWLARARPPGRRHFNERAKIGSHVKKAVKKRAYISTSRESK